MARRATVRVIVRPIGFADSSGPEDYNLRLSRRLCQCSQGNTRPSDHTKDNNRRLGRLHPTGTPNDTVEGRSRNRRVDLKFATDRPPGWSSSAPRTGSARDDTYPSTESPGGGGVGQEDATTFCEIIRSFAESGCYPFLCPLICLVAPEICATIGCALLRRFVFHRHHRHP